MLLICVSAARSKVSATNQGSLFFIAVWIYISELGCHIHIFLIYFFSFFLSLRNWGLNLFPLGIRCLEEVLPVVSSNVKTLTCCYCCCQCVLLLKSKKEGSKREVLVTRSPWGYWSVGSLPSMPATGAKICVDAGSGAYRWLNSCRSWMHVLMLDTLQPPPPQPIS